MYIHGKVTVRAHASLVRAHAASSLSQTCRQHLCTLCTIAFGGLGDSELHYIVFEIRLRLQVIRLCTVSTATTQKGKASTETSSPYSHGVK